MKKIALIAAAMLAAGAAQAQTKPASPFYGEAGFVFLTADISGIKANPTALRGIAGWNVHQYVALEVMVAAGVSDDNFDSGAGAYKAKVENAYGVYIKPKYALNDQFEVFGRVGFANSKVKLSTTGLSGSDSDSDVSWGLGATYKFNKQWYGAADYTSYFNKDGLKVDGFALNVGYRF
ncbi:Opacity protein [Roseateles sp. YR242]|uniref:porin family protein n=1 Tax=Roseateles sp. YR242 TaxID=1855305 RepID=UPI0008D0F1A2|nr:porin family protein [Roseateles sp. YR242]SEK95803.1 Opacity protein [Roseateles sp. YR242]